MTCSDRSLGTARRSCGRASWSRVGLLFALKGGSFRSFYRWLARGHAGLFGGLPERTRLLRLLAGHRRLTDRFRADPTFFSPRCGPDAPGFPPIFVTSSQWPKVWVGRLGG